MRLRADAPSFHPCSDTFQINQDTTNRDEERQLHPKNPNKKKKEKKDRATPRKRRRNKNKKALHTPDHKVMAGQPSHVLPPSAIFDGESLRSSSPSSCDIDVFWALNSGIGATLHPCKLETVPSLSFPSTRRVSEISSDDKSLHSLVSGFDADLNTVRVIGTGNVFDTELEAEAAERERWRQWAIHAAEKERQRRIQVLKQMEEQEQQERHRRRAWALHAIEEEQRLRVSGQFLSAMTTTQWFNDMISSFHAEYEVICPYSNQGCRHICLRKDLEHHLSEECRFGTDNIPHDLNDMYEDPTEYEVVCPNAVLGCGETCSRSSIAAHLQNCRFTGPSRVEENEERAYWKAVAVQQQEVERARRVAVADERGLMRQVATRKNSDSPAGQEEQATQMSSAKASYVPSGLHTLLQQQLESALSVLHEEILDFYAKCQAFQKEMATYHSEAVQSVQAAVKSLWEQASVEPYGSVVSGLMSPVSDLDLVVNVTQDSCVSKASDGEIENGTCQTEILVNPTSTSRIQQLADHLDGLAWIKVLKVIEHTAVPLIKAEVSVAGNENEAGGKKGMEYLEGQDVSRQEVKVDISIMSACHSGLATTALTCCLLDQLPSLAPLVLVLKRCLAQSNLQDPFTGGLPSYGLILMMTYMLLHQQEHRHSVMHSVENIHHQTFASALTMDLPSGSKDVASEELEQRVGSHIPVQGNVRMQRDTVSEHEASTWVEHQQRKGVETARSVLMQEGYFLGRSQSSTSSTLESDGDAKSQLYDDSSAALGKLLMEFLHLFGEDFEAGSEGLSVRGGGFRFNCKDNPAHPLASDPIIIEDPVDVRNNVGRSTYRICQVQKLFAESLSRLKALIARFNETNSEGTNSPRPVIRTGILPQILKEENTQRYT